MPLSGVFPQPAGSDPCADSGGTSRRAGPLPLMDRLGLLSGEAEAGTEAADV